MINDVVVEAIAWPLNLTLSRSICIAREVSDVQNLHGYDVRGDNFNPKRSYEIDIESREF